MRTYYRMQLALDRQSGRYRQLSFEFVSMPAATASRREPVADHPGPVLQGDSGGEAARAIPA